MRSGLPAVVCFLLVVGICGCTKDEVKKSEGPQPAAQAQQGEVEKGGEEMKRSAAKGEKQKEKKGKKEAAEAATAETAPEAEGESAGDSPSEPTEGTETEVSTEPTAETASEFQHLPLEEILKRQARYAQVDISWDKALLDSQEKELVKNLIRAARVIDGIFWTQASPDGTEWRKRLLEKNDPTYRALLRYLLINYGVYDRLDDMEPFIGEGRKPDGANYYPVDMTKEEFEKWIEAHPDDEASFKDNFTVIRRKDGALVSVPYSVEYGEQLRAASDLLKRAASLSNEPTLTTYLNSRAEAFLSNVYRQSDMDWMDLDSKIEVTIGPYEVYEDKLFGYKAAFEAFITVRDKEESDKLKMFESWLDKLEQHLPIPDEHKNFKRGKQSPMFVVDVIYTAGDTRAGVQTIAFNLPNDEWVREQKGSKKVMLRNVATAKFEKILTPISARVLSSDLVSLLHPEAFFNHTLLHEIAHGLGPGTITVGDKETTVNLALKEAYAHLEEAKADILGLYNALYLVDEGVLKLSVIEGGKPVEGSHLEPGEAKRTILATFLAGIFRSTRFGIEEAHGKANAMILNYLIEKGSVSFGGENGTIVYDPETIAESIRSCANELLMIQALGDYEGGRAFMEKYGKPLPEMTAALARLTDVPVDIEPVYDVEL